MISYVKYPIFPGDDTHGTPSRTYLQHRGCCPVGYDADHLLDTTMLNTNLRCMRSTTVGVRAFPVGGPQLYFTVRGDVGTIH